MLVWACDSYFGRIRPDGPKQIGSVPFDAIVAARQNSRHRAAEVPEASLLTSAAKIDVEACIFGLVRDRLYFTRAPARPGKYPQSQSFLHHGFL
jgi:hypothetical protein